MWRATRACQCPPNWVTRLGRLAGHATSRRQELAGPLCHASNSKSRVRAEIAYLKCKHDPRPNPVETGLCFSPQSGILEGRRASRRLSGRPLAQARRTPWSRCRGLAAHPRFSPGQISRPRGHFGRLLASSAWRVVRGLAADPVALAPRLASHGHREAARRKNPSVKRCRGRRTRTVGIDALLLWRCLRRGPTGAAAAAAPGSSGRAKRS